MTNAYFTGISCWLSLALVGVTAVAEEPAALPPLLQYESVFKDYQSFEDLPDISWREANDTVGRIGGWRSYARIVQGLDSDSKDAPDDPQPQTEDGKE